MGAIALRSSVYALPNREECVEVFERISRELEELGGQATSRMAIPRCGWRTTWTRRARCSTAYGLKTAGIDLDAVTRHLAQEGVQKFSASYDRLIAAITRRRDAALAHAHLTR